MTKVNFYDSVDDELIKFVVIIARTNGKWLFCKHKDRETYEVPGGHREIGESIIDAAKRELWEETGAINFSIAPVCVYSVIGTTRIDEIISEETYGMLFFADIFSFEKELQFEIESLFISDTLINNWTYPLIQPKLMEEASKRGFF